MCLRPFFYRIFLFISLFCNASPIFCLTPRLLIQLDSASHFSPSDLQNKMDLHIVSGDEAFMEKRINELDRTSSLRLIVVDSEICDLALFSRKVGYDYIMLHEHFDEAINELESMISFAPLTDADLPRTDPKVVGQFYDMMRKVDFLLTQHHLKYWATCGTLLGMVRHQGMIPWDDDIDLAMMAEETDSLSLLQKELNNVGLDLCYYEPSDFYKIFPKDGISIYQPNGTLYPWKYPFIDIFPLIEKEGKIVYRYKVWQTRHPADFFLPENLVLIPFGPIFLPAPKQSLEYLQRVYGDDWNDVAYVKYDHRKELVLKRVKVTLQDRSPPEYILP